MPLSHLNAHPASRPPAVAGMFYPGAPAELAANVDQLLAAAAITETLQPKALIVPHAGYIYSGSTAAMAYAMLAPWRASIRRVILLGPTHRVAVDGLALPKSEAFATPLGTVPLDKPAIAQLADLPQIVFSDHVHAAEHSLEVHLPFLQRTLDDFTLVPLAVGNASPQDVAEVLDRLWGDAATLIVISSDLSHFLTYASANQVDRETCQRILQLDTHIHPEQACGAYPINGLLLAAGQRHLAPQLIYHCNSGDTAGDKQRVVGYAAFAFYETAS
ncbi:MAG: AmmeMemoRadiSam system protein B [Betaproteobacteria bacterium HGW-Betaproteobacteria-10]|nr:MAG: AmmeMemoRadiSam system protein B [Betaproteobacteria bacterium HGW-Betaproteobacteria-10]